MVDPVREVLGLADPGDQLKVADTLPDRHVELMRVNKPDESLPPPEAPACFRQQIRVAREQSSPE